MLSASFGADTLNRVLLGAEYFEFARAYLPAFAGGAQRLQNDIQQRVSVFTEAIEFLQEQIALWTYQPSEGRSAANRLYALVLDTNVLEEHPARDELAQLAPRWLERSGQQLGGIALSFAAVTLEEIDRHKSVNQPMHGSKKRLSTEARRAQRLLADLFSDGEPKAQIASPWHQIYGMVQARPLDHVPLPIADNEIISYALELTPFAQSVTFISYDLGPCITARQQGLNALRLEYEDTDN